MDLTGNTPEPVASAKKIAVPRRINGVLFDGEADITIPAVDPIPRIASSEKGAASGVATLDGSGMIPAGQLPSYVDDVLEFANLAAFPGTGESGKIYIAIDTRKIYRWSGSVYVEISPSPGSTDSVTEGSTNLYFTAARALAAAAAETVTSIGALFFGASAKATPVDADLFGLSDSAASNVIKKTTWAQIKATLKAYFDTLYLSGGGAISWTPVLNSFTTSGVVVLSGKYSRVGDLVTFSCKIDGYTNGATITSAGGTSYVSGLPFAAGAYFAGANLIDSSAAIVGVGVVGSGGINTPTFTRTGANIYVSGSYLIY